MPPMSLGLGGEEEGGATVPPFSFLKTNGFFFILALKIHFLLLIFGFIFSFFDFSQFSSFFFVFSCL